MVKELQYTSINRVLDNLKDDENMQNLTLEQVVRHTLRFMEKFSYPKFYRDKQEEIDIHEFRGLLPCDLVSIIQVKDTKNGICMRDMTDSFYPEVPHTEPFRPNIPYEGAWKTQGRVIYTSFPEGRIELVYKAVQVDENGFPMLLDNEMYLDGLEAYITLKVYTTKFRNNKVSAQVLNEVQQSYALAAKALETEFSTPSVSEVESMTRYFNSLIPRVKEFDRGFKHMGSREYLRKHQPDNTLGL